MAPGELLQLDQDVPFVAAVLGVAPADLDRAAELLHQIEQRHGLALCRCQAEEILPEGGHDDAWVRNVLHPFLTETHLFISGEELQNRFELHDREGREQAFTWREWGEYAADWANARGILRPEGLGRTRWSQKKRPWQYFDFYDASSLDYLIAGYAEWVERLERAVARKVELFGSPFL